MAGYGKRPLWQWVLLYVVIGGVVYYGIYYFFFKQKGYNYKSMYGSGTEQSAPYSY